MFLCCPAEDDYVIQVHNSKGKILQYTCHGFLKICRCLCKSEGTLMYSYFPNGEVKAVLGIDDSSSGM